jgi:uncharacterized membrane protein YcaP (DUF421 family)
VELLNWHTLQVNLLELGASPLTISVLEKVIRPVVVYLMLVLVLRLFGKRILAQLNPFDFVVLLTLSNTVQNAIIGNDTSLSGGAIGAAALLGVNAGVVRWFYRGPKMEHRMLEATDIYLIRDFRPDEAALRRLHINIGELTARAHERGFDELGEVETAVLYPNGTLYMKGGGPSDTARLTELLTELKALRQEVAALRTLNLEP